MTAEEEESRVLRIEHVRLLQISEQTVVTDVAMQVTTYHLRSIASSVS